MVTSFVAVILSVLIIYFAVPTVFAVGFEFESRYDGDWVICMGVGDFLGVFWDVCARTLFRNNGSVFILLATSLAVSSVARVLGSVSVVGELNSVGTAVCPFWGVLCIASC